MNRADPQGNEIRLNLASSRRREGLTQRELADRTGIPQRYISEMETGKRPIDNENANILAKVLNQDSRSFLATTETKQRRRPLTFPRGLSGKGEFNFSDEVKSKIIALLGEEHIQGVWIESSVYILSKQYHDLKSVGEKNKELVEIKNHVESLLELFSDQTTRDHLLNKAGEIGDYYYIKRLAKDPSSTFTSLKIIDDLKLIHTVCSVAILLERPGAPGRPKGTESKAEYELLERLYFRCRTVYGKPLPSGKNLLTQLVNILKESLGLCGNLPDMVRKVIERNKKAKQA
jgi:transcriptional regulator with XRE-family HTH domain